MTVCLPHYGVGRAGRWVVAVGEVDYVFVDHPTFLERVNGETGAKLYGPEWGQDATPRLLSLSDPWFKPWMPTSQIDENPSMTNCKDDRCEGFKFRV